MSQPIIDYFHCHRGTFTSTLRSISERFLKSSRLPFDVKADARLTSDNHSPLEQYAPETDCQYLTTALVTAGCLHYRSLAKHV